MRNSVKWRVYYDDGSTFDSTQGNPDNAPPWGVICINQISVEHGRNIAAYLDYYVYDPEDGWIGIKWDGVIDRLANRLSLDGFLVGRTVSRHRFQEIMLKADKDPDFPPKTGQYVLEKLNNG